MFRQGLVHPPHLRSSPPIYGQKTKSQVAKNRCGNAFAFMLSAQRCKTCSHYPRKAHQDSHGTCLENRPYAASKGCIPLFENLAKETLQLLAPSLQPALTLRAGGILGCARSFSDLAAWYCDDLRSSPQQRALCAFADTKFTLFCFPPHAQTLYFPRFPHPTRAGPSEFCIKK